MNEQGRANVGLALQISFIFGVGWGAWGAQNVLLLVLVSIVVGLATVFLSWKQTGILFGMVLVLGIGIWYTDSQVADIESTQNSYKEKQINVAGRIVSYPKEKQDAFVYVIEVNNRGSNLSGEHIRVYDRHPTPRFRFGERIRVDGELVVSSIDSYRRYLASTGEIGVIYRSQINRTESQACGVLCRFVRFLFGIRTFLLHQIGALMPGVEGEFLKGILTGHDDRIPEDYQIDFQRTGITHLLAISGYHVTILMLVVRQIFQHVGLGRNIQLLSTLLLLGSFVIFIGFHGSVIRASMFLVLVLFAQNMGRYFSGVRALVLAATILAVISPLFVAWNIAFHLSFMAALGIFSFAPIKSSLWNGHNWKAFLGSVMIETFAAEVFVLPLIAQEFGLISLVSFIANLVIVPFVPFLMASGLGLSVVSAVPGISVLASPVAYPVQALVDVLLRIIEWLAALSWSAVSVPAPGWAGVAIAYVVLGIVTWVLRQRSIQRLRKRVI